MTAPRTVDPVAPRMLPTLNDANRPFWTGGADGQLLIAYCDSCERWVHPPVETCPTCTGTLGVKPVSGLGTLFTFTVNEQPFNPDVAPPYNIAIVVLDEQDDLRIPTGIVGCDDADLTVGMRVKVAFEPNGEVHVPLFEPA